MGGSFLGPSFSNEDIAQWLTEQGASATYLTDEVVFDCIADELISGKVVGWFQGRMEFGPRALGGRSILGDARNPAMQSQMNQKIKYRESSRPFAPSVLHERVAEYFALETASPYLLLVSPIQKQRQRILTTEQHTLSGLALLHIPRSDIPAVTHVDYSARIHTVHQETNPRYYQLLKAFEQKTGCGVLINTSFNVRGEPIVCSPEDAYRCFMRTEMDVLVLENWVLYKAAQPPWREHSSWQTEFKLD